MASTSQIFQLQLKLRALTLKDSTKHPKSARASLKATADQDFSGVRVVHQLTQADLRHIRPQIKHFRSGYSPLQASRPYPLLSVEDFIRCVIYQFKLIFVKIIKCRASITPSDHQLPTVGLPLAAKLAHALVSWVMTCSNSSKDCFLPSVKERKALRGRDRSLRRATSLNLMPLSWESIEMRMALLDQLRSSVS